MTSTPETDPVDAARSRMTARRAVHGNPGPRPALRFEGEEHWVVAARPIAGEGHPDDAVRPEDKEGKGPRSADRRKGKGDKNAKRDKTGKDRRRRKAEKKRVKESTPVTDHRPADAQTLAITLPEEFRLALERAAGEHGLTSEGLATFVLVEWLDR